MTTGGPSGFYGRAESVDETTVSEPCEPSAPETPDRRTESC
jgi:hypothetical protein